MENTAYKKKAGIFATGIILADYLVRTGANILISNIAAASGFNSDVADIQRYELINNISGVGLSVFSLVLIFLGSYTFTKDKRKTVVFAGSIYFAKKAAGLITSLISAVATSLMSYTTLLTASARTAIIMAGNIIALPVMIALAYFVFTAFEGVNTKFDGRSLANSEMLLSQARKRYFVAYVISMVIAGVMTSGPSFVMAYLTSYGIIDNDGYNALFTVIAQLVNWLSGVIGFAVIYCIGYKPYKNHINGMSFISISGITGAVSGVILSVVMLPLNTLLQSSINSQNYGLTGILSGVIGAASLIAFVIEVLLVLYVIKFFFAPVKVSLFENYNNISSELSQEAEGVTEETFEDMSSEITEE